MTKSFDGWRGAFDGWLADIDCPTNLLGDFRMEPKYADPPSTVVEFGAFTGKRKWRELA